MSVVIFLRGLNTYPSEELRFGPINLGLAHQHLGPALEQAGFHFQPLVGIRGGIEDQIRLAAEQTKPILRAHKDKKFHVIGHSAGGIIARGLVHQLKNENEFELIKSVVTITSPNYGSQKAQAIVEKKIIRPAWQKALRLGGHDIENKTDQFIPWLPQKIAHFNQLHPDIEGISYGSVISGTKISNLPIVLQLAHKQTNPKLIADGIVELDSQPWGHIIDQLELDHGAVLGLKTVLSPFEYAQNKKRFLEMVNKLVTFMKSL